MGDPISFTAGGAITAVMVLAVLGPIAWRLVNIGLDRVLTGKPDADGGCKYDKHRMTRVENSQEKTAEHIQAIAQEMQLQTTLYQERSAHRDRQLERVEDKLNQIINKVA